MTTEQHIAAPSPPQTPYVRVTNSYFSYFVVQNLAGPDEALVIRYSGLLRGTESAWQALSYGLESLTVFAQHGGVYMNFALWAVAILPAWFVVRHFGVDGKGSVEAASSPIVSGSSDYKEEQVEEHVSK